MQVFVVGSFVVACSVKVARLPRPGESLAAEAFVAEPGGKGFNLALAAHRLGADVDGVFAIGNDALAAVAKAAFVQVGFSSDMLVTREGSTGAGIGFIDRSGENCLAVSLGANRELLASDVDRAASGLAASDFVMATFESPDAPIAAAFAHARSRGCPTLLNPSPNRPIPHAILADTTILVVNRVEAADLGVGIVTDPDTIRVTGAEALLGFGPDLVIVTLGEAGAIAFGKNREPWRQTAYRVPVVDTIGAGDAFAAGFAVSLLQTKSIEDALRRAAACGAIAASRLGALDAFPTIAELERFLAGADG